MAVPMPAEHGSPQGWLNSTTLGIGVTSLLSDWSHEMATAVLPALLVLLGAGPTWLGAIEGVADGLSSITKLLAGHFTDRLRSRKPLVVVGYAITAAATGAIGFAANALDVLFSRSTAWLARGIRTPARKALLASAVRAHAYGRAFGFERMMDTVGAILAPLTALWLLRVLSHNYRQVLLWTLVPGLGAALSFAVLVRENRGPILPRSTFLGGLRELPRKFRLFLAAAGIFGLGDFSHTLLILYATQRLTPVLGTAAASSLAVTLYLVHNVFYAAFAYIGGWLSDRVSHRKYVLASGYAIALAMAALLVLESPNLVVLTMVFAFAGTFNGVVEALEDSMTAAMVPATRHGMAYGTLAAVNAVGDFGSSLTIGALWGAASAGLAFSMAGALFAAAFVLILVLREQGTVPLESVG